MDQTTDTGYTQLHEISQLYGEMPDYVKRASREETLSPKGLAWSSYADNTSREFPCHTKAATYVSALYFEENKEKMPDWRRGLTERRLKEAAADHGILADIEQIVVRGQQLAKESARIPDDDFMIPTERRYPLRNNEEVKAAAQYLVTYRDKFELDDRIDMARRVLRKAALTGAEFSEDLDVSLQKQAGAGTCEPGEVLQQLNYRSMLHDNNASKEAWQKIANRIQEMDPMVLSSLVRSVAVQLDRIDRNAGVKYGSMIKRPEEFMFGILFKDAAYAVANSCGLATGSVYTKDSLSVLSHEDICDLWGEKAANEMQRGYGLNVEKIAEKAASLDWRNALVLDWRLKN
jgi:hypothetical protein